MLKADQKLVDKYFKDFCSKYRVTGNDDQELLRLVITGKPNKNTCYFVCGKYSDCLAETSEFCNVKEKGPIRPYPYNTIFGKMARKLDGANTKVGVYVGLVKRLNSFKHHIYSRALEEYKNASRDARRDMHKPDKDRIPKDLVTIQDLSEDFWNKFVKESIEKEKQECLKSSEFLP